MSSENFTNRNPVCTSCGWRLKTNSNFCPKCGKPLTIADSGNVPPAGQPTVGVQTAPQGGIKSLLNFSVFTLIGSGTAALMAIFGMISWFIDAGVYDYPLAVLYGFTYLILGMALVAAAVFSKNRPYLIAIPIALVGAYIIQCFFRYGLPNFIYYCEEYPYDGFANAAYLIYRIVKILLLLVALVVFILMTNKNFRNFKYTFIFPGCSVVILALHIFAYATTGIYFNGVVSVFYVFSWMLFYLTLFVFSLTFVYDQVPSLANLENTFKANMANRAKAGQPSAQNPQPAAPQSNAGAAQKTVYEPPAPQQTFTQQRITENVSFLTERSVAMCVILQIVTLGIYGLYWDYCEAKDIALLRKQEKSVVGEFLCLLFVPFYSYYWLYTRGEQLKEFGKRNNLPLMSNGIIYLLLGLFGVGIVASALIQNDLNNILKAGGCQSVPNNTANAGTAQAAPKAKSMKDFFTVPNSNNTAEPAKVNTPAQPAPAQPTAAPAKPKSSLKDFFVVPEKNTTAEETKDTTPPQPAVEPKQETEPAVQQPAPEVPKAPTAPSVEEAGSELDRDVAVLEKLMELKEKGIISEADYEQKKAEILSRF